MIATEPDLETQISVAYQAMLEAPTAEERAKLGRRFTELVRARNEFRSAAEIAELETARGLR